MFSLATKRELSYRQTEAFTHRVAVILFPLIRNQETIMKMKI